MQSLFHTFNVTSMYILPRMLMSEMNVCPALKPCEGHIGDSHPIPATLGEVEDRFVWLEKTEFETGHVSFILAPWLRYIHAFFHYIS